MTFGASTLGGAVANIPVMVYADNSATFTNFWSGVNDTTNGYDIVFTDSDGETLLDYHFEKFNYGSTEMEAWVEVPQVDASDTDYIYMYYGKSGASNTQDETGTYDTDGNYAMVQHMQENFQSAS